jgi:MFS family permease
MPVYAHRFGLSGFQQGVVLGATGLAALAVSMPAGTLSDRFGARRLTLAAGLLMTAAMFAQALAGSFPALLTGALTQHLGLAVPLLATAAGFAVVTGALGSLRAPSAAAASRRATAGLRAAARDRGVIGAAAAVVVAGLSTGACALLVPAQLYAAGPPRGRSAWTSPSRGYCSRPEAR